MIVARPAVGVIFTVKDSVPGLRIVVNPPAPLGVTVNVVVSPATAVADVADSENDVGAPPFVHVTDRDAEDTAPGDDVSVPFTSNQTLYTNV